MSAKDKAIRIVRALCLAETIPFKEWQEGSEDRAMMRNSKTRDLDCNFQTMVQWVESIIESKDALA